MDRDSRYYRPPPASKTKFRNNFNSNHKNYFNNQLRKRRSDYELNNVLNSKKDIHQDDWLIKLDKMVKQSIPEVVEKFTLVSYKEIEEELEKLNYSKNDYNYLEALDQLLQIKKIYLVHSKPDVFAKSQEVPIDKLERYLIYLHELKQLNTIKNAPKKPGSKVTNNSSIPKLVKDCQNLTRLLNDNTISSTTTSKTLNTQKINDTNETKTDLQSSQVTSTHNNNEQNQVEENCKEESIKDLPNKIVISNMVASKTGDKQKAKRRKARRIRKATKNNAEKKAKAAKEQEENKENELKNDDYAITTEDDDDDDEQIVTSTLKTNNKNNSKKQQQQKQKSKSANQKQNDENLKYENSSQISSSSDSEESLELLPDSEIYPSPEIYQKISDAGFDYESIITRFANWNRSPISALNEFGQICHISVKLEITDSTGPDHAKLFQATAFLDKKKLSIAWGKSKKRAKGCASELAIRAITASLPTERCDLDIQKYTNHFDQLAVLSYAKFNELLVLVPNYVNFGRKIVATILMKTSEDTYGKAIAVGTGNRCVSGEHLVTNGKVIFDSHAEVIARRSFLNYLIKQVEFFKTEEQESIFIKDEESDLLVLKPDITFHLYISTAPCGDGALFTHSSNQTSATELDSENHEPLFETFLHGRLRTKMEAGEGTISLDENYSSPELDQILRGERLRTMSCSDKICRWNLLGIQGCLLLHFIKPIYLSSISLGALYHNGHLSRACCCRLEQDYFKEKLEKNNMFKINHPSLGCPTSFKFPREPVKTKSDSLNWSLFEEVPELTNGNTGVKFNMEESRICKHELFNRFKKLCTLFGKDDLNELTYFEVKEKVEYYNELKRSFFDYLKFKKYGPWVCKPIETKVFK